MIPCTSCGASLRLTAKICIKCGHLVTDEERKKFAQAESGYIGSEVLGASKTPPKAAPLPQVDIPTQKPKAEPTLQPIPQALSPADPVVTNPIKPQQQVAHAKARSLKSSSATIAIVVLLLIVAAGIGAYVWKGKQETDAKIAELQKKADEEAQARKKLEEEALEKQAAGDQSGSEKDGGAIIANIKVGEPSFDCEKATTQVEKAICNSKELSLLDGLLAYSYRAQYTLEKQPSAKEQLKTDQSQWLKNKRNICKDDGCLRQEYNERLSTLAPELTVLNGFLSNNGWAKKANRQGDRFCDHDYAKSNVKVTINVYCAGDGFNLLTWAASESSVSPPQNTNKSSSSANAQTINYSHGTYVGEVANGRANGQGTYTASASGIVYKGSFVNDRFNGSGTMTWKDGAHYVGTWQNDVGVQGTMIYPNGKKASGAVMKGVFTPTN